MPQYKQFKIALIKIVPHAGLPILKYAQNA